MIVKYKYGFEYKGFVYAWKDKELYRLPCVKDRRSYGLKKAGKWKNGYYVGRDKKSITQLKAMTIYINKEIQTIKDADCPF